MPTNEVSATRNTFNGSMKNSRFQANIGPYATTCTVSAQAARNVPVLNATFSSIARSRCPNSASTTPPASGIARTKNRAFILGQRPLAACLLGSEAKPRAGMRRRSCAAVGRCAADSPAVLGLVARRETRSAHCVRCARTIAASQMTKRALRARGHEPCAPRRRTMSLPSHTHPRLCRHHRGMRRRTPRASAARWAVPGVGDLWGGEKRSAAVGRAQRAS